MPHHKPVILFLTNSELGQASVVLAVAHELVSQSTSDVHVASFPALKQHADALNVPFHALPGRSMKEALADSGLPYLPQHAPGSHGAVESYRNGLQRVVAPWEPEDYAPIYRACLDLINKLSPDLVVVGMYHQALLISAINLCRTAVWSRPGRLQCPEAAVSRPEPGNLQRPPRPGPALSRGPVEIPSVSTSPSHT